MRLVITTIALWGGIATFSVLPTQATELTAEQVRVAIRDGAKYLKNQQQHDGSWVFDDPSLESQHFGGMTGLCTLALLNAGVEPEEETIQRALGYLRKLKPTRTYTVALQTMVFCMAEPTRDQALIARNVDWLEATQIQDGDAMGSWAYPKFNSDNSNSQFAVLALYEAERIGVKVEQRTWRISKAYWERMQNPDGSWGYRQGFPGTGSMTCAGIASLVIVNGMVHESDAQVSDERIVCCNRAESDDDRLVRAVQWLSHEFAVTRNPGAVGQQWVSYYLYCMERVGRLTARRFIGEHDWYREGTAYFLRQRNDIVGNWVGSSYAEKDPLVATSLALLFLSKGRRPILMTKLRHGEEEEWNAHRSDVAHMTRYTERRWKRDLTWQVVHLESASVEDLLESPVLYFSGKNSPKPLTAAAEEKLARKIRDYIDRGGFLFAEANCDGKGFDRGFRELMRRGFPEPEYALRPLSPEHPIWRTEERVDPKHVRPLYGIEFGCRTSVVYCPPDASGKERASLSCLWELFESGRDRDHRPAVDARIDAAMSMGINVLAYATNRELSDKSIAIRKPTKPTETTSSRFQVEIVSLRHPGGCNAAPRAFSNLLERASAELKLRVNTNVRQLNITDERLFEHHLVFMHGRNAFRLTDAERKQLKTFIDRGGLLFVNSICASKSFTESFRREMGLMFPEQPLEPVTSTDPLLTSDYGGFKLDTVTRRDPQQTDTDVEPIVDKLRKVSPELEGIRLDGRWGVIFSRFDLSCALEKHNSLECQGYTREDAARIGLNVLLYSLQ